MMRRVLVAPLDWGLGHASRCIPIIKELLRRSCEVIIAGSGDSLQLLREEFPQLRHYPMPGYHPVYPRKGSMAFRMMRQVPGFLSTIRAEHHVLEKLIQGEHIDLVISDNRYGCWSARVPSVFITHQSNILMPERFGWLQGIVRYLNGLYMGKFTRCWIPDFSGDNSFAGALISSGKIKPKLKVDYIGPISRFNASGSTETKYDIAAVFSGPEPQRTLLEDMVMPQLKNSRLNYFVVRGILDPTNVLLDDRCVNFLTSENLQKVIESSKVILARSGYSTVMDLAALKKKAIFIPTPGQTEQLYLASRLMDQGIAFCMSQDKFNLALAWKAVQKFSGFSQGRFNDHLLMKAIDTSLNNFA